MGKRGRARNRNNRKNHSKEPKDETEKVDTRKPYQDLVRENESFETYYKRQNICKDDWDEFLAKIKSDLKSSFRITATKGEANALLNIVENQFIRDCKLQDAEKADEFFPLPWYPNRMGWQLGLSRKDIRRNEAYYRLHNFLISETENGTISRQETVSMIPPLVLDIQSHHKILDMCAAPGSKTAQLIELLHCDDKMPTGFVIANDIDNNRCYMLVHQAKRLNSPCIAVTNHNSQFLPNLFTTNSNGDQEKVEFDRILCDVPCSGDGTLRKNPDIWMKWTAANGLNQHGVQFRIALRGAELLAVGGRMVYSTCSLNPVENEAVIHRLLKKTNGALQLVDVGSTLKGLKYAPGMEDWLVSSRHLEFYEKFDEVDEKWRTTIRPEFFPPTTDDRKLYNLNKCIRIFPHYQDTGAFFVAVLEKVKPYSYKKERPETLEDTNNKNDEVKEEETIPSPEGSDSEAQPKKKMKLTSRKKRKLTGYREDPFVFFKSDEDVWSSIKEFYSISDEFDPQCLLTRCHVGKKKNIYYCSPAIRDIVKNNQGVIKFINTGVKTFVRSDNRHMKCAFRLAHEGLESIIPCINGRILNIPKEDLLNLLANTDPLKSPEITSLTQETQDQVNNLAAGSCILCYKEKDSDDQLLLYISGWRGKSTLRCYITDFNASHYLRLLGGDISKYDVNKFKKAEEVMDEDKDDNANEEQ